jgi:hypothetical protein
MVHGINAEPIYRVAANASARKPRKHIKPRLCNLYRMLSRRVRHLTALYRLETL